MRAICKPAYLILFLSFSFSPAKAVDFTVINAFFGALAFLHASIAAGAKQDAPIFSVEQKDIKEYILGFTGCSLLCCLLGAACPSAGFSLTEGATLGCSVIVADLAGDAVGKIAVRNGLLSARQRTNQPAFPQQPNAHIEELIIRQPDYPCENIGSLTGGDCLNR